MEIGALPPADPRIFKIRVKDDQSVLNTADVDIAFAGQLSPQKQGFLNEEVLLGAWRSKQSLGIMEAGKLNAQHSYEEAYQLLRGVAREAFVLYSETQLPAFAEIYEKLILDAQRYRQVMDSSRRKAEHSVSVYSARARYKDNSALPDDLFDKGH